MVSFDLNNKHFTKWLLKYDGKHRARLISKVQSQLSRMGVTGESMKKALLQLSQQTNVHLQRLTAKEIKMYERDSDYNGWNRKNPKWHRILTSSYNDLCDYDYDQTFYSGSHNSVSYAEPHPASSSRSWSSDTRGEEVLHWNSTDPGEQHRSSERYYNEVCNEREFYHDQPSGFSNKDDYGYYRKKRKWGCDSVDSADYRATKNYEERRTSCEENITYHEYDNYRDRSRNFGKGRGRTFNKYSKNGRRQWEVERNSIQKGDSSLSSERSIKKEQVSDILFQVDENHSSACSNKMNTKMHSVTKESKLSLAEINNKPSLGKLQKSKIDVNVKQADKNRMDKLPTKKFKKKNHIEEKEEMPRISVIVNGKSCKSAKADEKRKTEVTVPVKQTNLNEVRKKVQSSVVPEPLHCTSTSLTKSDNYHSAKSDSNKNTNASDKAEEGANVQATKQMKESDVLYDSKSRKVSDGIPQPIAVKSKNSVPDKDDFPKSFNEVTESTKKTNQKVNVLQGSEKTINVTSDKDASSDVKRNKQIGSLSEQSLSVKAECGIEISKPSKDAAVSEPKVLDRAQKPANVKASHGREKLQTDSVLSLEGATVKKVSCDKMCTMPKKVDSEGLPSVDRRSKDSVNVCEKSVDIKTKDSSEVHKKLKDSTPRSKISDRTDRPQKGSSKVCESSVAVKIKSDSAVVTLSKESNTLKPKINDKTEKPKQDSNSICEPSVATKTKDDIEVCKVLRETSTPKVKNSDRIDKPKQDTQMFQVTDKTQDSQVGGKAVDGNVCCDTKGSKDTDKLCDHVPIKMQDGDNVPKSLKEGSKPKQVVSAEKIKEEATMSQATRETVSTLSSGRRLSHEEKRKKDCDNVQGQLFAVKTESRDRETFKDTSISDKQLIINRNEKSKENINISQATDTGVSALSSEKVTSKVECCYDKREKSKDPGSVHDQMQGSVHARTKDEVLETLKEKSLSKPLTNIETEKMKESSFEMQAREKTVSGLASENLTNKVVCYNEEHNKDTGDREQSLAGEAKNREEVTKTSDPSKPVISVAGEKPKENLCVLQVIEKHVNIQDAACEGENRKGTDCNTSEECVAPRNEIEDSSTSKESNPSMEVIHTDFVTKVDGLQTDNAALNIGSDESCAKKMDDNFILEYIGGEYVGEELVCGHFTIEIETTEHEIDREDGSFYVNDNSNISREKPEVSRGLSSNTAEEFDRRKHSLIQYPMMDRKNEESSSQQVTSSSGPQNGFAQSFKKCVKENEISSHSKLHRSQDDSSAEQILHTVPIQRAKNFELKEKFASEKSKRIEQLKSFSQHTVNHRSRTPSILFQPGEVKDLSKVRTTKRECYTTVAEYYNQTNLEPDSKVKDTEKIKVPCMAKNVEGKVRHGNLHLATNQNKFPLKTTENSDDIIKSNVLSIKKIPSHNIAKKPGDATTNKKLTKETLVHSTINTSNDGSKCKTKEVPIKITPEKSDSTFKIKTVPVKEVPSLVHSTINTSNDGSKCKTKEVPIKITPEKSDSTFKIKTVPAKEVPSLVQSTVNTSNDGSKCKTKEVPIKITPEKSDSTFKIKTVPAKEVPSLVQSTVNTSNDGNKCKTKEVPIKITPEKSDNTFKIKTVPAKEVPSLVQSTVNTSNDGNKCKTKEVPIKITPEKSVNTFKIKTVPVKEVPSQHNNVKSGHEMNKIMLAKKSSHPFKTKSVSETEILVQTSNTETSEICTVRVGTELKNRIASILNSHYKGKPLKNIKRRSSEPASSGTSKIHKKRRFSYDGDDAASCRILLEKSLYQKKDTAEMMMLENKNVCKKNENKIKKEGTNSFTNKPKEVDKLKLKEDYRTSTDIVVGSKSTVPKVKKKFSKSKRMLELFGEDPEEPARKSSKCPGEMKTSAAYNASTDALGKVLSHAEKTLAVDSCRNTQKDQHSQHKDSKIDQPVLTVEITDPTRQGNLSEKLIINDRNLDIVFPSPQVQVDGTLQLHSVNTDNFINPVNVPNKGILNSLKQASVVSVNESVSSLTTMGSTATERREHEGTITKDIHGKNVKASVVNVNEHVSSLTTVGSTATECREHEEIHGKSVNKLSEDKHTKSSGGIVLEQKQLDKSSAQSETINEGGHLAGGRMPLKHSALSSCPQVNAKNQDESGPGKIVADSIQNFESVYIKVKVDDVEDGSTPVDTSGAEEKSKDQQQSDLSSQGGTTQSDHLHLSTVANTSLSDSVSGSSNNTGGNDKVAQQPTTSTPIHSAPSDSLSFGNSTVESCHVPQQSLLITEGNPANESHSNSSEILRPERTAISCESSNVHSNKTSNSDISSKPSSGQRIRVRDLSSMMKSSYSSLQHPEISNHPSNMQLLDIPSSRTQPTNTVVSSEQDLSYLNILQQPETVVQPNSVQQPEIAVQSNGVQQTHVVVHSNNVQQTQVAVHPNTVQQTQVVVHSSSVEQPEVAVHSNNVQQPKVTVHSNSVQQSEVVVQSNNVQQPEVVIQSNSVHQPDVVQSNSVQQREVVGFNTLRQPELGSQHNVNMQTRPESFSFELMDMKLNRLVEIIYMIQKHIDRCMEDFKSLEHVEVAEEVKVRERHFSRSVLCKYVEVTLRDFLELRAYITNFLKEHADGIILERLNKLPIANNVPFSQEKLTQCYNICESVRRSIQKAFHLNKQQVAQNNAVPHHQSVTIPNSSSGGQSASCQSSTVPYAPHSHSNILLSEGSSDVHLRDTAQRSQIVGQVSHQSQANGNTSLPVGPVQFPQQSQTSSEPVHSSQIPHQRRASNTSVPVGSRQIAHQSQGNYNTSMPVTQQPRAMIRHVPLMNNDSSSHSQFPPSYNQHMRQTASGLNVNYPMNSSQALQYDNNGNRNINMHNQQMYRRQQSLPTHMSGRPVYPYSNYMPSSMPASNGAAHSQWNLVSQNGNHLRQLGHSTRQMIPNPANNRENNSASNYEGPVSALGHPQNRDLMHHLGNSARHTVPNLTSNTGNASVPNYGGQVSTFAHPQNRNPVSQLSHSSGQSIPSSSRNAGNNPSPNTDGTFSGYGHTQNRNPVPHLGHLNRQTVPNSGNTGNGSAANFVAPGSVYGHSQNRNQVSDLGRSTRQAISNSANNTGNNSCDGPVPTFQGTLNSTMSTYPFPVNHSVNNCSRAVVQGSEQVTPHLREMLTSQVHPHSTRNNSESMARPSGPPQPPPSQPLSGQLQFSHSGGSYSQQQTHVQRRSLPDPSCFDNRSSEHQNQVLQQVSQSHQTSTVSSNTQAHDAQVHGKPQTISHRRMSVERRVPHENSSESNTNKEKSQSRPPPLTNIPNVTTMQSLVNNTNYQPVASALSTFCQVYANFVVEQRQQKEKFGSPHQKVTNACSDTQVPGASVNRNHWNGNRVPNMVMNTQELVSPVGGNQVLQIQQYQLDKNQGVQSTTVNSQPPISVANNESSNNQNGHSYVNSAQIQNIPNSQRPLGAVYTNQISHSQNTPYAHVREQNASLNGRINSNQTCLNQNQQQPNIQGHCQLTDLRYQNVPVNMQMQGSEVGNNQSDNVSHIQKQLSRYQMLQNALVNSHTSIAAPDGTREGQMLQQCHADNPREVAESASSVNDGSEVSSVNQQVGQQSAQNMSERETSRITVTLQNKSQESGKRMSQPDSIGSKHGTAAHTEPRHSHTSIAAPDGTREGQMLQQCHADNPREVAESASSVNDGSEVSSVNQQVGQQSAQNMSERETSRITVTLQNKSQESGKRMSQPDSIGSKHGTAAHTEPRHKSSDNILSDAHSSRTTTFVGRLESVNSNEVHELTVSNKSQHHPFVSSQKTASTTAEVVERRNSQQETNEISSRVPSRQSELNVPRAEERPSLVNTSESTGESDSDIEVIHEVVVLEPRTVSRDSGYTTPSPMVGQIPVKDDQEDAPGGKMFNCEPVEEQKMYKMLEDEDYVKEMQPADEEPEDDKLTIWFEREDTMPLWRESESEGNFQAWHELEDVIVLEETSDPTIQCAACNKDAEVMCTGCRIACYCSVDCQLEDWNAGHHKVCCGAMDE